MSKADQIAEAVAWPVEQKCVHGVVIKIGEHCAMCAEDGRKGTLKIKGSSGPYLSIEFGGQQVSHCRALTLRIDGHGIPRLTLECDATTLDIDTVATVGTPLVEKTEDDYYGYATQPRWSPA